VETQINVYELLHFKQDFTLVGPCPHSAPLESCGMSSGLSSLEGLNSVTLIDLGAPRALCWGRAQPLTKACATKNCLQIIEGSLF